MQEPVGIHCNQPKQLKPEKLLRELKKLDWQKLPLLSDYQNLVASDLAKKQYPGSPLLVNRLLRPGDRAWFFELHPGTVEQLHKHCFQAKISFVRQEDGFKGLISLLPTQSRRALVLIDPSYEIKSDYQQAVKVIAKAYEKMPQTIFMLWYPVVERQQINELEKAFIKTKIPKVQLFEYGIDDDDKPGMTSSGVIMINPPWTLKEKFESLAATLSSSLANDNKSRWRMLTLIDE